MTRRLLFDQNLSPRLVRRIEATFDGSVHVGSVGLAMATDAEVLEFADTNDLVIVTKDKDFADLVTVRRSGPPVLWLILGNATTDEVADAILGSAESIQELLDDAGVRIVQLARPRPRSA